MFATITRGFFKPLFSLSLSTISCNLGFSDLETSRTRYMAPMRYGEINHWIMLKAITKMGIRRRSTFNHHRRTVKNKVDKPMITANVPRTDKRSCHKPTVFTFSETCSHERDLNPLLLIWFARNAIISLFQSDTDC